MHNAFVGNIKNIICCSCPQGFAAIWEDMIYMHEMLNKDSRFEWQYRNINHMSNEYYQLVVERSMQTGCSEKALLSFFTLLETMLTYTFRFYQISYLMVPCLFIFSNVSQILVFKVLMNLYLLYEEFVAFARHQHLSLMSFTSSVLLYHIIGTSGQHII